MSKKNTKNLGIVLILLAVFLPTYLVINRYISEVLFGLIATFSLIVGFLIYKIDEVIEFETKFIKLKTVEKEVFAKAKEVQELANDLREDKRELREATKIFIESFYLSLATRNRFPPPNNVLQKILNNLNLLAVFAIKDQEKRGTWIKEMQALLNPQ